MTVTRTARTLADGREIIYFDDVSAGTPRDAKDTRPLDAHSSSSQLRCDPLTGEWVTVASQRQSRTFMPSADDNPLAPSRPGHPTEVPESSYDVVVFENRFPSFSTTTDDVPEPEPGDVVLAGAADGNPLVNRRRGRGRCEVVCFSSDAEQSFRELSPQRVATIVEAWADRTSALSAVEGVQYVFPFENRGVEIGVTLSHPHGQIYGYPFIPPTAQRILDASLAHRERTGRVLYADLLAAELESKVRIVAANEHWTAFVPAAARWPVEVHLAPNETVPDIPALSPQQRAAFGPLYLRLLSGLDALYDKPLPYIAAWRQAPVAVGREAWGLHLVVFSIRRAADKLKYLAGSESGMGAFISDVVPEEVAARLREVVAQ